MFHDIIKCPHVIIPHVLLHISRWPFEAYPLCYLFLSSNVLVNDLQGFLRNLPIVGCILSVAYSYCGFLRTKCKAASNLVPYIFRLNR